MYKFHPDRPQFPNPSIFFEAATKNRVSMEKEFPRNRVFHRDPKPHDEFFLEKLFPFYYVKIFSQMPVGSEFSDLVAIIIGFKRSLSFQSQILRLFRGQLCQFDSETGQMKLRHFFIE